MSEMDAGCTFEDPIAGWESDDSPESSSAEDPYDPMHESSGTGETYASSYLQEIAEADLPTASADLPTAGSDTDQDGALDTVPGETAEDGGTSMTEHMRDDVSPLSAYDAEGDGSPEPWSEGVPAGDFTGLSFNEAAEAIQDLPQTLPPPPVFGSETAIVTGSPVETKAGG
ncbi:hypothetical protein ACFW6K_07190 [Streptomyces sp. NPDC058733]|uniref:hypothetical protein n=1 Tax=Streptomyces sp. NPDC058733 TaxID=3346614 RepID=UPI0036A66841